MLQADEKEMFKYLRLLAALTDVIECLANFVESGLRFVHFRFKHLTAQWPTISSDPGDGSGVASGGHPCMDTVEVSEGFYTCQGGPGRWSP